MAYEVPPLPYAFEALEPHIDAKTMEIHHDKHHAAYVNNANGALEKHPELASKSVEDLLRGISSGREDVRTVLRNTAAGIRITPSSGPSWARTAAASRQDGWAMRSRARSAATTRSRSSCRRRAWASSEAGGPGCWRTRGASFRSSPTRTRTAPTWRT